jgi:hypothetical protein
MAKTNRPKTTMTPYQFKIQRETSMNPATCLCQIGLLFLTT